MSPLDTLGNIVASCVSSVSSTSAACASLFSHASTTLGTPDTVFAALLNIAAFPASQVANLYGDAPQSSPFQPALTAQPNDFSLGITFSPTAITAIQPSAVAIDGASNIWMANCQSCQTPSAPDSLLEFSSTGAFLHTFNGIAVDNSGELWATAVNAGAVIQATPNGNLINGSPFFIGGTTGVAVDNIGNIWFGGTAGNNIVQFDTNGDFLQNFTPAGLNQPLGIAINGSNEIWTVNNGSNSVSKIEFFNGSNGSGSPYTSLGLPSGFGDRHRRCESGCDSQLWRELRGHTA